MSDTVGASRSTPRVALLVCALVAVAFVPTLSYPFSSWDDPRFITDNLLVRSFALENLDAWVTAPIAGKWRPLTWLSFALDDAVFGLNPVGFRITALGLHLLATLGVLALGLHVGLSRGAAAVAAVVFGLHPAVVEPVVWLTARNYLLATPLTLAALLLAARQERVLRLLAVLATLLALLAHELAVVVPLLIALDAWRRRARPTVALPHLALALVFGVIHLLMARESGVVKSELAATQLATVTGAATLALAPVHLSPFYTQAACLDLMRAGLSALVLVALCVAWRRAPRAAPARLLPFALGWAALAFLPTAGIVPTQNALADRWLCLPLVGFALLVAHALTPVGPSRPRRAILVILVMALVTLTLVQQRIWRSPVALWERGVAVAPSHTTHQNLGGALLADDLPRIEDAELQYEQARLAATSPMERALSLTGLAGAALRIGMTWFSGERADRALVEVPTLLQAHLVLAQLPGDDQAGRDRALAHARIASALAPDEPEIRNLVLALTRATGAPADEVEAAADTARATLRRALETILRHDPGDDHARDLLESMGR